MSSENCLPKVVEGNAFCQPIFCLGGLSAFVAGNLLICAIKYRIYNIGVVDTRYSVAFTKDTYFFKRINNFLTDLLFLA